MASAFIVNLHNVKSLQSMLYGDLPKLLPMPNLHILHYSETSVVVRRALELRLGSKVYLKFKLVHQTLYCDTYKPQQMGLFVGILRSLTISFIYLCTYQTPDSHQHTFHPMIWG